MTVFGIDVSHWQNPTPSLTGLSFLFAKASEGTTKDAMYDTHIKTARLSGLVVGAYAFNRNDVDIVKQCDAFIAAAGDVDLYAIDIEGIHRFSDAQARQFIDHFRAVTGKKIGVYASASGFPSVGQDWNWVAKWTSAEPTIPWTFWQYQGSPLDRDEFHGTIEQLHALVAVQGGDSMDYHFKAERWLLDGGPGKVTSVGEPILADGSIDSHSRLCLVSDTGGANPRLVVLPRTRLTSVGAPLSDEFFTELATYTDLPLPVPDTSPFTQAQLDAAVAAQKAADQAALTAAQAAANIAQVKVAALTAKIAKAQSDLA